MTRAWGSSATWVYRFLVARDGEKCKVCGAAGVELLVDHVDKDPRNSDPGNLRLLCRSCNRLNARVTSTSVRARESPTADTNADTDPTESAHRLIDYQSGSPEMQAAGLFEVRYRSWVEAKLCLAKRPLLKRDLINGGAEEVGCSVATSRRYLDKMVSPEGKLRTVRTSAGPAVWWKVPPDNGQGD